MEYINFRSDDEFFDGNVWAVTIKVTFSQTRKTVKAEGHQSNVEENYQVAVYADDAKMAYDMAYKFIRSELIEADLFGGRWVYRVESIRVKEKQLFLLLPLSNNQ